MLQNLDEILLSAVFAVHYAFNSSRPSLLHVVKLPIKFSVYSNYLYFFFFPVRHVKRSGKYPRSVTLEKNKGDTTSILHMNIQPQSMHVNKNRLTT